MSLAEIPVGSSFVGPFESFGVGFASRNREVLENGRRVERSGNLSSLDMELVVVGRVTLDSCELDKNVRFHTALSTFGAACRNTRVPDDPTIR